MTIFLDCVLYMDMHTGLIFPVKALVESLKIQGCAMPVVHT